MIAGAFGQLLPSWIKFVASKVEGRTSLRKGQWVLEAKVQGYEVANQQMQESGRQNSKDFL
mgnify:CR=1 FL=1